MRTGASFELGQRWREGIRNKGYISSSVLRKELASFDTHVCDPQACQSAGASRHCDVVARALVRAARALVLVSIAIFLVPCVFACCFVSRKQAAASSCWRCRELKHTTTAAKSMRRSRWLAITRSLESPPTAVCHDTVSETGEEIARECRMMYGWCGPARYASSVGFKTSVRSALGPYRTGAWFRLARPFSFEIHFFFLRFCFWSIDKSR